MADPMYAMPVVPEGFTRDPDAPGANTTLLGVSLVFFPLAVLFTVARIYTRAVLVRTVSLDDYLMIAALICSACLCAFVWNLINFGLGKHLWNVLLTPELYPNFGLYNLLAAIAFCIATGLAKGSILLFYLRIFPSKKMVWTVWTLFAFTIGYSFACGLVNLFSCNPVAGSWKLEYATTAICINRPVFYFAQAALSIFTDITTVVCPLPVLRTLRLPFKQKIGIAVVLTMGASVCVISIVRLYSLYVLLTDADLTYNTPTALMWCILELNLSIIGGNIPAAKPLLTKLFPRVFATSSQNTSAWKYHNSASNTGGPNGVAGSAFSMNKTMKSNTRITAADNGSEEYIMQDQTIRKTVEYGYEVSEDGDEQGARPKK